MASFLTFASFFCILAFGDKFNRCRDKGSCYQECSFESTESQCDTLPAIPSNSELNGKAIIYRTSHSGEKFEPSLLEWTHDSNSSKNTISITIDSSIKYQKIIGFGAAFTDAVVYNLNKMQNINDALVEEVLYSYFSWNDSSNSNKGGAGYIYGRIPIASCDFSPYSYTYSAVENDFDLEHFALTEQDFGNQSNKLLKLGRIDIIKMAQTLIGESNSKQRLHLFATPWTAPPWLKVDQNTDLDPNGYIQGRLNPNRTFYWQTYALYFVKYIQAYKEYGNIEIEAVTVQNEPHAPSPWESMKWTDLNMMEFISEYLGPLLQTSFDTKIQIWIHDGYSLTQCLFCKILKNIHNDRQKGELPEVIWPFFELESVSKYISGIAMHWYLFVSPTPGCPEEFCTGSFGELQSTYDYLQKNDLAKDVFMIGTEACSGFNVIESPPVRGVSLGDWNRGMQYAKDIIGDIQNGLSGWVDWNFILDMNGGPNHVNNTCDAPIVADFQQNKYYKQPMYYHMAHISRYVLRDSQRISIVDDANRKNKDLWYTAVVDAENLHKTVIILMNSNAESTIDIQIYDDRKGYLTFTLMPHSIQTILYAN